MNLWKNYHIAESIDDALETLIRAQGKAQIIAGGTDLLLDIQQGRKPPVHTLVDITEIPELCCIKKKDGEIFIGAAVSHKRIANSRLIQDHCYALADASNLIGGPQVRNIATLGGNVAHALPAADGTIALMALNAQAEIASRKGEKRVPLKDLFAGPGKSRLIHGEDLLTGFYINTRKPGQSSAFKRVMRPQGVAIAILNIAVWLQRGNEIIEDIRIAIGPSGPTPRRIRNAEKVVRGHSLNQEVICNVYDEILGEANFRTSTHRATKEYRQKIALVLLEDALRESFQRAELLAEK